MSVTMSHHHLIPSPLPRDTQDGTNPLVHVDGVLAGDNVRNGGALLRLLSLRGRHGGMRAGGMLVGRELEVGWMGEALVEGGWDGRGLENVWARI